MATATIGDNTGNTFSGTDDTELKQTAATTNYGTDVVNHVLKYAGGDHAATLIKFTGLSSITGPVTVSAATLYMFHENPGVTSAVVHDARRCLRNWVEAQATWNIYSTGNSWGTGGTEGNATDRSNTISASVTFDTSTFVYRAYTGAQLIADVQDMINNPSTNYGWVIERNGTGNDSLYTTNTSSEGATGQRPYLDITYSSGGGGGTALTFTGTDSLAGGELL